MKHPPEPGVFLDELVQKALKRDALPVDRSLEPWPTHGLARRREEEEMDGGRHVQKDPAPSI